jgi:formylglycine-generating enzyme required for sulfatase activity
MVEVPGGTFLMGSPQSEEGRYTGEGPQHNVTIRRFAIGKYEITVGEYRRSVEGTSHQDEGGMYVWTGSDWKMDTSKSWRAPGFSQTDRHPVVGVNWFDARNFCLWLGTETGRRYRLPSEAEWEYAARAGSTTRYAFGDSITATDANFGRNVGKTTEVGAYPPNAWGLHDMHGNVGELVEDAWHDSYEDAPANGSAWTHGGGDPYTRVWLRLFGSVLRGGSWYDSPRNLRSASRFRVDPRLRGAFLGFRCARTLD